ncbi:ragulator complex protein LAMTOR1 [Cloeon dipterum]|uniref:ragulator complex protein LAMTOR1 n=1 Tax=Cloeon dipterum TaxID=197152 RepID=UPI00322098A0
MGNCCDSCCGDDANSQSGEVTERSRLLEDPVSNNTNILRVQSDDFLSRYPNSMPKTSDEQSALNRILQETASNVIDVAALDSHTLEQHEYRERVTHYTQRLNGIAVMQRWRSPPTKVCLLADLPAPEKLLSTETVLPTDLQTMNYFMEAASEAMSNIKVEHKEDLVVPFRIP